MQPVVVALSNELTIRLVSLSCMGLMIGSIVYLSTPPSVMDRFVVDGMWLTRAVHDDDSNIAIVDFLLAMLLLNPLWLSILITNASLSSYKTTTAWMLLLLRMSCCVTIAVCSVGTITYTTSRRTKVLSLLIVHSVGCLIYSWLVPCIRWYVMKFRNQGLVHYLPSSMQRTLLRESLLDWLSSSAFYDKIMRYYPFLFQLNSEERTRALRQVSPAERRALQRRGIVHLLPGSIQQAMLPVNETRSTLLHGDLKLSDTMSFGFNFDSNTDAPVQTDETLLQQLVLSRISRLVILLHRRKLCAYDQFVVVMLLNLARKYRRVKLLWLERSHCFS